MATVRTQRDGVPPPPARSELLDKQRDGIGAISCKQIILGIVFRV